MTEYSTRKSTYFEENREHHKVIHVWLYQISYSGSEN